MSKLVGLVCTAALLLFLAKSRNDRFSKYKAIEAYEVRPGIVMMPRYSADAQICEIVMQREHYVNGVVRLDSALPREVVTQIFDELAPPSERGPLSTDEEIARLSMYAGNSVTSLLDYKNVSLDIYRPASSPGDVVALVQWKGRACR